MLRVGVTGGIAAGKSTTVEYFHKLGAPVIDADRIAREVTAPGSEGLAALSREIGHDFLASHGGLDRTKLRQAIFGDTALRARVEKVLHPLILAQIQARITQIQAPYCILDIPLLAESASARTLVDRILVVDCPAQTQIERLRARDGDTTEQARLILAAQADRQARLAIADDVIDNGGSLADLDRQVRALDSHYRNLAQDTGAH